MKRRGFAGGDGGKSRGGGPATRPPPISPVGRDLRLSKGYFSSHIIAFNRQARVKIHLTCVIALNGTTDPVPQRAGCLLSRT